MPDPWTVLGWLIVLVLVIAIIVTPIAFVRINGHRRRMIARMDDVRDEVGSPLRPRAPARFTLDDDRPLRPTR
jgi:hypothetical protein